MPRQTLHNAFRADGDEAAVTVVDHSWDKRLGHQDVLQHAGAQLALVIGKGLFQDGGPRGILDDRVSHQDVWWSEGVHDRLVHHRHRLRLRHIGLDRHPSHAQRLEFLEQRVGALRLAEIVDPDIGATPGKDAHDHPTEFPTPPGHHRNLLRQVDLEHRRTS